MVTIKSLANKPSVPGPEYLEAECINVTKASNQFCSDPGGLISRILNGTLVRCSELNFNWFLELKKLI